STLAHGLNQGLDSSVPQIIYHRLSLLSFISVRVAARTEHRVAWPTANRIT
ncbi:MAG: hypothetical protein F6K65_30125, partial [Moorea sp. SIO3C2]|nr:hypothetical protein [Moorena sp. SIO3C2]